MMKSNINDYALVQLTAEGVVQHGAFYKSIGMTNDDAAASLRLAEVDNGRHRFQIWELMCIFGNQMFNGNPKQMFTENAVEFVRA